MHEAAEARHLREVEAWRAGRLADLNSPRGWRALAGLAWLREGSNTVGSDPGADVVLPAGPASVGEIEVDGRRVVASFDPGAGVTSGGEPVERLELRDDSTGKATVLEVAGLRFHVIDRDGALGVRVRDPSLPARRPVEAVPHFPVDVRWRIEAHLEPPSPPREVALETVAGVRERFGVPGTLRFEVSGTLLVLEAFRESRGEDLFIIFGDATNGRETYGGGRYLHADPPGPDGVVVLDFNRAYNPPCVFTPFATCALAPPDNRLPVRIEAGELRYEGD